MLPEEKLANLILKKYKESPPVNVHRLVTQYAKLIVKSIPVDGVDGVSLDIKVPGKSPIVILNADISPKRQRFTLAHELGHIVIPWHVGDVIADRIFHGDISYQNPYDHFFMEGEANRFAAELLMPESWILSEYESSENLAKLHEAIAQKADVSVSAASIKIIHSLPFAVAFCKTDFFGYVKGFGQSKTASITHPETGQRLNMDHFNRIGTHSRFAHNLEFYHWWLFEGEMELPNIDDDREWRDILNQILEDIGETDKLSIKRSLSGVIGSANGSYRPSGPRTVEGLFRACLGKMDRSQFKDLLSHKDFEIALRKRVEEILTR